MAVRITTALAAMFLASCTTTPQTAPDIEPHIAWLETHTGRSLDYPRPTVEIMSQPRLSMLVLGPRHTDGIVVLGTYHHRPALPQPGIIGLRNWDGDVIAHELVHWAEHMERRPICEADAYAVQLAYAREFGSPRDLGYMEQQAEKGC